MLSGVISKIRFSHEAANKEVRINTYLNCYAEHPAIHLKVGVENLKSEPLQLDSVTVLGISDNRGCCVAWRSSIRLSSSLLTCRPVSSGVSKRLYEGFLLSETDARLHPSNDGVKYFRRIQRAAGPLVFGFLTTRKSGGLEFRVGCQSNAGPRVANAQ